MDVKFVAHPAAQQAAPLEPCLCQCILQAQRLAVAAVSQCCHDEACAADDGGTKRLMNAARTQILEELVSQSRAKNGCVTYHPRCQTLLRDAFGDLGLEETQRFLCSWADLLSEFGRRVEVFDSAPGHVSRRPATTATALWAVFK